MKVDDRIESLLQEEMDGALPDADRETLAGLVASDPLIAAERRRLQALGAALSDMPMMDPPASLLDDILAKLPTPIAAPVTKSSKAQRGRPRWQAFALAAGMSALAVGLGLGLSRESGLSPDELGGTLLVKPVSEARTGVLLFDERPLTGTIRAEETDASVLLHVDLQADDAAQLSFSTPADTLDRRVAPGKILETWEIKGDLTSGVQVTVAATGHIGSEHLLMPTDARPAAER
ncbi:MAG: hypothetical protein ACO3Z6_06895 [Pseudomonadales bacterium]